ncbi:MAG: thrombospondin type 3 repeat-containing protein, partial [Gammaproteobacteria bacterium]|nr:thrombospondin type 3 repeat-containing protein [Gammaproteobacteria bacterium]
FQPQLRVYAPGGGFIAQDSDYDVASVVFQAESNGTYTIVASDDDYDPRQAGSYELRVIRAPLEVNGPMLVNGGFVDDHMDAGDLDAFVFMANAGEGIQIRVADLSGDEPDTSLVLFHPAISVYGPNGSSVRIPDTVEGYDVAGFGFDAPQSGKYTAVVRDESRYRDEGGDYRIYLTRAPGANKDGALIDGQIFTGSIELGELDSYTLQARRGDRVTIGSTASSELYYLRKTVYDPLGRQVIVQPYNRTAIFTAERTGTYTVVLADDSSSLAKTGVYSISLDIERNGISYAALGDSYSAGEGVRPYETLDEGWDEGCHRSTRAYSKLLRVPGTSLPISRREDALYDFHACTGAVTNNIRSSGTGQDGEPPQLAAVNHVDSTRDLVTMSLGGNDAHFADILMFCFAHEACNEIRPFEPFSDIQLGDLFPLLAAVVEVKLLDVYAELRAATPNAPTLIMEYPQVVGGEECAAAKVPFADHLALSESEQAWMRDATRQINAVVQAAAAIRGLHFVPVAEHFDGHEVCGRYDDWILGLNLIDRERLWDPNASFHPTARGQYELARVANSYLESISTGWPFGYHASGLPRNPSPLLPVAQFAGAEPTSPLPSFGDLNVSFANAPQACAAVGGTITPGAIVVLRGVGFAPNESIQISLKLVGEASVVLGNVAADDEGGLDAVFDLPESLKVGGQGALQALGAGPDGVGRLLLALVQIQSSLSVDGDGDGVPDSCDNCPNTSNTDQSDLDFDGRGDTCDLCSQDPDNDQDGDGLCAIFDACPLDPYNDIDGDGHCALEDNCAITYNPDQADGDGDGIGDACEELACYPVSLVVHQAGAGNVTADATNCGLDAYFEGTHVGLRADSEPGQFFTGWSGDLSTAENPFSVTVTA